MDSLKDRFLKSIAKQIFPGNAPSERMYWTFLYRFDPDWYHLRNKEVGEKVTEIVIVDCVAGFGMYLREVIKKIVRLYRSELEQDGITEEALLGASNGHPSFEQDPPWVIAYRWLWGTKYPRWQEDYIWESWKQVASKNKNSEWIQFFPIPEEGEIPRETTRRMKTPKPIPTKNLPIETQLFLKIELDSSGGYFLLFNRGLENQGTITKYLVIPSQAFAPSPLLEEITLIPQENAMCEDIEFDAVGKEEYIGILVDRDLDLPWLNPDPEHPVLEWQGKHLGEVWEQLQGKDNWQVFYRDFEIVSPNG